MSHCQAVVVVVDIYVDSIVVDVAVAIVDIVGCGGAVATIFMK